MNERKYFDVLYFAILVYIGPLFIPFSVLFFFGEFIYVVFIAAGRYSS